VFPYKILLTSKYRETIRVFSVHYSQRYCTYKAFLASSEQLRFSEYTVFRLWTAEWTRCVTGRLVVNCRLVKHSLCVVNKPWCSVPAISNSLPKTVVNSDSVIVFTSRLKTFLFSRAFLFPFVSSTMPGSSASKATYDLAEPKKWYLVVWLTLTYHCLMSHRKLFKELLHASCLVYTLTQPSSGPPTLGISSKRQLQGYTS